MTQKNSGALGLTWSNKQLRLLANDDGTYEWVEPSDFRVSEVRLLNNVATVGDVKSDRARARDNLLIRGDSLHALTSLLRIPEFSSEYEGKVKLVYIDPPFNTGQTFAHYDDGLDHSVWLTMLRDRLIQIQRLLRDDGSVWLHLDDYEQHRGRLVLDEIFGIENFVSTIVWEKAPGAKGDTDIAGSQDYIHVYAKDKGVWKGARNLLPRTVKQAGRYANPDNDPRGPWRQGADSTAKSGKDENRWPITTPSGRVVTPAAGRYWAFSRKTFDLALREDRVYFGKTGDALPIIKTYLETAKDGVVPRSWWPATEVGSNQEAKRDHLNKLFPDVKPFDTPKPERLMRRIIHIASNPGDVVLDCFAGSGTTAAVAHKMGRRWVAVEWSAKTLKNFTVPRLEMVLRNEDPLGVTDTVGWAGGGGFRVLDVAPSVYTVDDSTILLAENVTAGELAESVAAQLGFTYEPDGAFCGRRNAMRLAVIDGVLNTDIIDLLIDALDEKGRVTIVATASEPGAEDYLRSRRPGSRFRKVPRDLARLSHRRSEVVQLVLDGLEVGE